MKYKFDYKPSAIDLWKLSMYGIYGSMVGVVNIIFTIAMILLSVKFWDSVNIFFKIILIFATSLFVFLQPMSIYLKAKKQVENTPSDMEMGFDSKGIHIKTLKESSITKWSNVKGITKKFNMIIIFITENQGFIITDEMIGDQKQDFYNYIVSKIKD